MNLDRFGMKAKNILGEWVYAEPYEDKDGAGLGLAWKRPEGRFLYHPVIKKTLCQCTGLRDSDGNLIYENDILEVETLDGNQIGHVYYQELDCSFRVWLPLYTTSIQALISLAEMTGKKVRVVGNKFDKEGKECPMYRATGLLDMQDAPVFEKDRVEIYDDKGDVLFSGVVLYSSQRAAFVLANPETGESYKHTLGELIKDKTFSITGGTDNGEEKETV